MVQTEAFLHSHHETQCRTQDIALFSIQSWSTRSSNTSSDETGIDRCAGAHAHSTLSSRPPRPNATPKCTCRTRSQTSGRSQMRRRSSQRHSPARRPAPLPQLSTRSRGRAAMKSALTAECPEGPEPRKANRSQTPRWGTTKSRSQTKELSCGPVTLLPPAQSLRTRRTPLLSTTTAESPALARAVSRVKQRSPMRWQACQTWPR